MPRVVIALPVFNGGPLLREALADLAAQTHADMQVIVFDNHSADETNAIAQDYAEKDKRFTVVRRQSTVPLFEHFRMTLNEVDAEFFGWRAYDDLSSPDYVARLAALLAENPRAWVAGAQVRTHAVHKASWRTHPAPPVGDGLGDALRLMFRSHASWMYGLFRREPLRACYARALDTLPSTWGADHATLLPMILNRAVVTSNEAVFIQRKGIDGKKPQAAPVPGAEKWRTYKAFLDYALVQVDEAPGWNAAERAVLKAALPLYASKRTYRLSDIAASMFR